MSEGGSTVIPSFGKIGLQTNGCGVVVDRQPKLTKADLGATPVEIRDGVRWLALNNFGEKRDCSFQFARLRAIDPQLQYSICALS
jgi:hypothetical protein